jgi:hypothetical protein
LSSAPEVIFRFDLDKTYLATDTDSLRALLRVPFERAEDKRTIPGVIELVRSLRGAAGKRGDNVSLHFLSASPPQIGGAIRAKLEMDGITYEGIRFKDQMRHLVRGELSQLREQIGYKLGELLSSAQVIPEGASEYLFGDDWESDAFIYSLYADIVGGFVGAARVVGLLQAARVDDYYIERIEEKLATFEPRHRVEGIFILRTRKRRPEELAAFGPRLAWFDNYFECALRMSASGLLDGDATARVAAAAGMNAYDIGRSFDTVASRAPIDGPHRLARARRSLERSGMASSLARGGITARINVALRHALGQPALRRNALDRTALQFGAGDGSTPYEKLVERWTHRGVKAAMAEPASENLKGESDVAD